MYKKAIKTLGKFMLAVAAVLTALIISGEVRVHADSGQTVRVTTAKELKAAIQNKDVGTILFRTPAYINVTIKADKAAKSKTLIIDAENASITNKAVFAEINIMAAGAYTENVSGNKILLVDGYLPKGLTVAKKKTLNSLSIYNSYGSFYNCYTLRKGAKIKSVELIYTGDANSISSKYNKSKRVLTMECTDDGCERAYTIKLDKNGRMTSLVCKSNWPETNYDEAYKYDSNGNKVKESGNDNSSGKYTSEMTYSGNLLVKMVYDGAYESGVYTYTYDKNGRVIHEEGKTSGSMDGVDYTYVTTNDYEYDKNGRLVYEKWENAEDGPFTETAYIYNSKGFQTEANYNNSGMESTYKFTYDKAGNLTKRVYTCDGYKATTTYVYDEFGTLLEEKDS